MSARAITVTSALLFCSFAATASHAQDAPNASSRPQVSFDFERKGLPVPKYRLVINPDGSGTYQGEEAPPSSRPGDQPPSTEFHRSITISGPTAARIFKLSQDLHHFTKVCASKAKNIADTGTKILTYSGPDGTGSCTYNYTENKDVQALTDTFLGIAETLDEGRQLDHLHRYDRLGLDAAIQNLAEEVTSGRALEIGTIEASLRSIASDAEVMERVRTRANSLLTLVPGTSSHP